jgi:hypothetical protein
VFRTTSSPLGLIHPLDAWLTCIVIVMQCEVSLDSFEQGKTRLKEDRIAYQGLERR